MKQIKLLLLGFLWAYIGHSQDYFPKNDGVKTKATNYTAITNAKLYITPTKVIDNGTLLIKDGFVVNSGKNIQIPENSEIIDAKGHSVYPSFIDLYSTFGVAKPKRVSGSGRSPQYGPSREGFYWNDHIRAEQNAIDAFKFDKKTAKSMLEQGFGVVNTHIEDGIVRGSGALIALDLKGTDAKRIISGRSAQYLSFSKSVQSRQSYPTSIMGGMALLRQLYHDADWYKKGNNNTTDRSIEPFNRNSNLVQIMAAGSRANALRADAVGDQFGVQYVILGGGDEYERIATIKNTNAAFIIPVNFPKPYDVENSFLANKLELESMKEWNQKPTNPKVLADHNIRFAFTTNGLKSVKTFKSHVKNAIDHGLSATKALEALTTVPSQILKNNKIGNLQNGSYANFTITSGAIFESTTSIYEHWIRGSRTVFGDLHKKDIRGAYTFQFEENEYKLQIGGKKETPKATLKADSLNLSCSIKQDKDWVYLLFTAKDTIQQNFIRFSAKVIETDSNLNGTLDYADGSTQNLTLIKGSKTENKTSSKEKKKAKAKTILPLSYPNGPYGFDKLPEAETLLFQNATVWTNENDGILTNTDVLVKNGEIAAIGKNLKSKKAKLIDATGKHLTAGIVDEHSHIAAASINEAGQNSSAEVSIEDVVDADDVDIYRNLSGGVTTIQILHGSANPIGGRSAIIKLKWGESAKNLIYKNTPKFIKFALGENVKQSNWESYSRFPQTRMGVEQMYIDYFSRAKAYDLKKKSGMPYRFDTEMEVLAEILNKERFISCHSYVQSEINMLMKVAERFDFKINTFTHILEGYKLADKMKTHGAGASTFSDWWAYKYEVNDAIPYNAAILNGVGVVTAINSDDAEMSRRLNQEAAKAVKYGGVSEEEAWKMVTLNPAKLLHIDDKVGSIKVGKDADLVLWSDHPLSIYAKAEQTLIEGVRYFDIDQDQQHREKIKAERNTLIQMMLKAKNKGMKTQAVKVKKKQEMHCDTLDHNHN
ncbi:amidohydrolase family protein [Flavobacteriaceae bacterium]|nr:amidohydrolase family protein [Flavobacteriaceae bacterium]MDB2631384.1 amidohydrolase family protein [Flavobacteriaceae bacterium]